MVGIGDPRKQAEQAMRNVKQLLEEAGSKLAHVCKVTVYITDRAYRELVYQEIGKLDGPDRPGSGAAGMGDGDRRGGCHSR
jgi:enamine deaminase RidA (YjgF/YER057c/UK114 family)